MVRGVDHPPLLRSASVLEEVDVRLLKEYEVIVRDAVQERRLAGVGFVDVQLYEAESPRFTDHGEVVEGGSQTGCAGAKGPLRSHPHG